jgi:rRNA-processing protein EBP2
MAFYKLALDAVPEARKLCSKYDIPFSRPNDYYAEMVKSDEHMERVRTKLVEEAQGIKKSEEAKKQRDLKKYGKQIQVEKLKQREADKRNFNDKVAGLKRKRKDGAEIGDEHDEFGIEIDNDDDEPRRQGRGGKAGGKTKMPRQARDAKYSLGGSSRRAKQNTRESANDIPGWGGGEKKGKFGKGGAKGGGGKAQRPGKARRHSRRK